MELAIIILWKQLHLHSMSFYIILASFHEAMPFSTHPTDTCTASRISLLIALKNNEDISETYRKIRIQFVIVFVGIIF